MVESWTETRGGRIETRHDGIPSHEDFSHEEITELLILLAQRRSAARMKLPLRKSLFPNVAPYVVFQLHNCAKSRTFPKDVSKHLTWDLGTGTPWIVKRTVENSGYRFVAGSENWCGVWSKCRYAFCYKILKKHQKMNHFPGSYEIGHKDRLWKNMSRLMAVFGRKQFSFVPRTFILPQELDQLRDAWDSNKTKNKWIIKPPASSNGRGIFVVSRWAQIPRKQSFTLVQQYLSRPKLINGSKFDLRLYALITDFHPLKIYVYKDGLVRFACAPYDRAEVSLNNRFIHLTNYTVNKTCTDYVNNDTIDERKGHKWSLKCFWDYMKEQEIDVAKLRLKIDDIIVKAIISGEGSVNCFSRVHLNSKHNCYELLGFDILIDEDLKPWLLEVNISPSLHASSALDIGVKGQLIKDVLNLAGYRIPATLPPEILRRMADQFEVDSVCQDVRVTDKELSSKEKRKQMEFMYQSTKDRGDCPESILHNLTPDDVRNLLQYEDELARLGQFQKIFPTMETHEYFRYFEAPRYYNMLLSVWEKAHGNNRRGGIDHLRNLCAKKYHLR